MAKAADHPTLQKSVRRGTAQRRHGKETAARLVEATYGLLESENLDRFTMRNVAKRAGVSLANLQYYFPTRSDLAKALFFYIGDHYQEAYEECTANAPASPLERLKAVLNFNMQDITTRSTRRFFLNFWALLGSMDNFSGRYLGELYAIDIEQLSEHIRPLQPEAPPKEIARRATLIAAMTEGLTVILGNVKAGDPEYESLRESAVDLMVAIASDDVNRGSR